MITKTEDLALAIAEAAMVIHDTYTNKDDPEFMKKLMSIMSQSLTPVFERLEDELMQVRSNLVIATDRDTRSRTGWRFASEAASANQRYIAILESELTALRSGK